MLHNQNNPGNVTSTPWWLGCLAVGGKLCHMFLVNVPTHLPKSELIAFTANPSILCSTVPEYGGINEVSSVLFHAPVHTGSSCYWEQLLLGAVSSETGNATAELIGILGKD